MLRTEIIRGYRVQHDPLGGLDVVYTWRKRWYWRNIPLWAKVISRLEVPDTEWIRMACTGDVPERVAQHDKMIRELFPCD